MSAPKRPAPTQCVNRQPPEIYSWDASQVGDFLTTLSLDRWKPLFEEVDGATLSQLSEDELKEIGCTELLPRKKLMGHIAKQKFLAEPPASAEVGDDVEMVDPAEEPELPEPSGRSAEDATLSAMAAERGMLAELRGKLQQALQDLRGSLEEAKPVAGLAMDLAKECLDKISAAHEAAEAKPVHVPLFGNTGAGKSTLLNAVLCQETVPTSGWRSCTAVPVELVPEPGAVEFRGEVHLKSPEAWRLEVEALLNDLLMSDRTRISRREPVRGGEPTPAAVAFDTLVAVYPEAFEETRPWPDKRAAQRHLERTDNRVTRQHRQSQVLRFSNARSLELTSEILDYVDSPDGEYVAAFWPLVHKVRISGPFECHPRVVLVDAPGVQDANSARASVVKQLLEEASGVVIVSAIKRAATEKVAQEMLGERFRRQMLMDGHYAGSLAFVATCTDELTLSELRKNLKIGDDVPQQEAAMLRNQRTKERILADTFAGIRRIQAQSDSARSSNEELRARGIFPAVFTTSARDYQKLRGLLDTKVDGAARIWKNVEDTEIPAFRFWLHAQGQKADLTAIAKAEEKMQAVVQKLKEASTGSSQPMEDGLVQRWAEDARHRIQAVMDEAIRICMKQARTQLQSTLSLRIRVGEREAAETAAQTFKVRCSPQGQGGLHWGTFKATCRREGEWRESFNELLADPLNRAIAVKWDEMLNSFLPQCVQNTLDTLCSELLELQKKHDLPCPAFDEAAEWLRSQGPSMKSSVQKRQMELSRQIKDTIQALMRSSYHEAAAQSGAGTDVRQKQVIYRQVTQNGAPMFKSASSFLEDELGQLMATLEKKLATSVKTAISRLEQSMIRLSAQGKEMEALQRLRQACAAAATRALASAGERQVLLQRLKDLVAEKEACTLPTPAVEIPTAADTDAVPNEFICPISQQVMEDPVFTADGQTYERVQIEKWLSSHSTSPITGKELEHKTLVPNHSLRKLIMDSSHASKSTATAAENGSTDGHRAGGQEMEEDGVEAADDGEGSDMASSDLEASLEAIITEFREAEEPGSSGEPEERLFGSPDPSSEEEPDEPECDLFSSDEELQNESGCPLEKPEGDLFGSDEEEETPGCLLEHEVAPSEDEHDLCGPPSDEELGSEEEPEQESGSLKPNEAAEDPETDGLEQAAPEPEGSNERQKDGPDDRSTVMGSLLGAIFGTRRRAR